jgi:hypothetical protein
VGAAFAGMVSFRFLESVAPVTQFKPRLGAQMPPPTTILLPTLEVPFKSAYTPDSTGKITIMSQYIITYRKISMMVATNAFTPVVLTVNVAMFGDGATGIVGQFKNDDGQIHTFDVVAPNFSLYLTGAFSSAPVPLIGWVFLN